MTLPCVLKLTVALTIAIYLRSSAAFTASIIKTKPTSRQSTEHWISTSSSPEDALKKTASQLERLQRQAPLTDNGNGSVDNDDFETIYRKYALQPANALKTELKIRKLPGKGTKPDLAKRLTEYDIREKTGRFSLTTDEESVEDWKPEAEAEAEATDQGKVRQLTSFCGLKLSAAAGKALGKANFKGPTPIQKAAIPLQLQGESAIIHAETGSGKTLAYLLPITEQLWMEHNEQEDGGYGLILTPTRELAAQVAGIATVLAPPGTVRLVSHATNLMSNGLKDRGEMENGGRLDTGDGRTSPRLFIGSAKAIMHSLYGDGKMPASPTTKPEAMYLLRNVRWLVLDEVDRALNVRKKHGGSRVRHEKPAAVVTSAVARLTLGRAQVVSASATVGRSLKRELSRILGLSPKEWPQVVREEGNDKLQDDDDDDDDSAPVVNAGGHVGRAVTIPDAVKHYVTPVDTSSVGKLLTNAFFVLKSLNKTKARRILLVLARGCDINTKQAIGALKHFGCKPEPTSLLDALEAKGTDRMIELHRKVSGAAGVGESNFRGTENDEGYLFVTGEDTVRGLHLDGLDVVVVVGSAFGPDEYTHIAGRTGRAGREGKVINVLSHKQTATVTGWEKMLGIEFERLDMDDVAALD